jgi:hypothetical protein
VIKITQGTKNYVGPQCAGPCEYGLILSEIQVFYRGQQLKSSDILVTMSSSFGGADYVYGSSNCNDGNFDTICSVLPSDTPQFIYVYVFKPFDEVILYNYPSALETSFGGNLLLGATVAAYNGRICLFHTVIRSLSSTYEYTFPGNSVVIFQQHNCSFLTATCAQSSQDSNFANYILAFIEIQFYYQGALVPSANFSFATSYDLSDYLNSYGPSECNDGNFQTACICGSQLDDIYAYLSITAYAPFDKMIVYNIPASLPLGFPIDPRVNLGIYVL